MAKYLRPRRGRRSTAESKNFILRKGEVFFEAPETGVGTGMGKIKMGDGITPYKDLPYYLETIDDVSKLETEFVESTDTNNSTLINNISSGNIFKILFGNVKKVVRNLNTGYDNLINNLNGFRFGINEEGKYGYYKNGEDVLTPFKYATGTATPDKVLEGYTFSNDTDDGIAGTMRNNGAVSSNLNAGGSYTIPEGYHNGYGIIRGNSLSSQTPGTATAGDVVNGKTIYVNGSKITGTMPEMGGGTYNPNGSYDQVVWCAGNKMTGNITINNISNLSPGTVRKDVNIGGVVGTWEGKPEVKYWLPTNGMVASGYWTDGGHAGVEYYCANDRIDTNCSIRQPGGAWLRMFTRSNVPYDLSWGDRLVLHNFYTKTYSSEGPGGYVPSMDGTAYLCFGVSTNPNLNSLDLRYNRREICDCTIKAPTNLQRFTSDLVVDISDLSGGYYIYLITFLDNMVSYNNIKTNFEVVADGIYIDY